MKKESIVFIFIFLISFVGALEYRSDYNSCIDTEGPKNTIMANYSGKILLEFGGESYPAEDYCSFPTFPNSPIESCYTGLPALLGHCYVQDYYCVQTSSGWSYNLYSFNCSKEGYDACFKGRCTNLPKSTITSTEYNLLSQRIQNKDPNTNNLISFTAMAFKVNVNKDAKLSEIRFYARDYDKTTLSWMLNSTCSFVYDKNKNGVSDMGDITFTGDYISDFPDDVSFDIFNEFTLTKNSDYYFSYLCSQAAPNRPLGLGSYNIQLTYARFKDIETDLIKNSDYYPMGTSNYITVYSLTTAPTGVQNNVSSTQSQVNVTIEDQQNNSQENTENQSTSQNNLTEASFSSNTSNITTTNIETNYTSKEINKFFMETKIIFVIIAIAILTWIIFFVIFHFYMKRFKSKKFRKK